jgi:hypothetical protein
LQDSITVQGVMMKRENNLDRLEAVVAENSAAIARNTQTVGELTQVVGGLTQAVAGLTEIAEGHERQLQGHDQQLQIMQAAMTERMDRFIRGLETDGHKSRGDLKMWKEA